MTTKRIKDLSVEATSSTLDDNDYGAVDSTVNGTRKFKLSAFATWVHNKWAAFLNACTAITSFASGDFIAVSNPTDGTRKMSKDTLLQLTSQNALAGNVAPEFVPNSTTTVAGQLYVYNGSLYVAKEAYQGPWDASKFEAKSASEIFVTIEQNKFLLNDLETKEFYSDSIDQFQLASDGFAPTPVACVVSYFNKVSSSSDYPNYPLPMGEWYPVSDLNGSFRYGILNIPTDKKDTAVNIGLWFKFDNIAPTKSVRMALWSAADSYVANFTRFVSTTLYVGATRSDNGCELVVDAKLGSWYHVTISVPANKNLAQIWLGSDYFVTTDRIYWSMPTILEQPLAWFVKYRNKYYPPKTTNELDDILFGKKVGWFGDSIMLGRHVGEDYGWYNNLTTLGCIVTCKAINGAMVSVKGAGFHSIINETGASTWDADTDYLIFDGGVNDFFQRMTIGEISEGYSNSGLDNTTYIGALEIVCYNLITNYPAAKKGYIIPYKMESYADIQNQKAYFDAAIEVCKKWGIPILDMRYMCGLNYNLASMQSYFKDDVHINKDGYILTENIIAEWMRTI